MRSSAGGFPPRLAKKHYWLDLHTRPFMRGLRNLTMTRNEQGRYEEALRLCTRLAEKCRMSSRQRPSEPRSAAHGYPDLALDLALASSRRSMKSDGQRNLISPTNRTRPIRSDPFDCREGDVGRQPGTMVR